MFRKLPGFVFAAAVGLGASPQASAQPPAAPAMPPAARPADPPPPIVDLTPVDLPERAHCNTPIDCVTCNEHAPAILTSAEYIIVRPRRRANDFVIVDPLDNLTPEGRIRNVQYDTDSAFRVGAGYRPGGSAWEYMFTYTYLHDGNDRGAVAPPGGVLYATLTRPGIVDVVGQALGSVSLNLNVYDLESIRHFQLDDAFTFKLGFGVRYANMDQTLQALYFGGDANGAAVRSHVCFDGFGLTAGGQGEWNIWRGFRLFGRARGSMIMADFDNSLLETNNGGATINANVSESYRQVVPVLELASGVAWEYRNLRVAVGYELQNWFNVIDSPTFIDDFAEGKLGRRKSDLSIEGITFQLGMVF
jgi:Legionella pneumophila major outer membrane protein precursor